MNKTTTHSVLDSNAQQYSKKFDVRPNAKSDNHTKFAEQAHSNREITSYIFIGNNLKEFYSENKRTEFASIGR